MISSLFWKSSINDGERERRELIFEEFVTFNKDMRYSDSD